MLAIKGKLVEKYPDVLRKLISKRQELLVDKLATKVTTKEEVRTSREHSFSSLRGTKQSQRYMAAL